MNVDTIGRPDRGLELGDEVFFYLSNSIEIRKGEIIGFFLTIDAEREKIYNYQIEYWSENRKEDGTIESKLMLACLPFEEISRNRETMENSFSPIRKERIKKAISFLENEISAAESNKKYHEEIKESLEEKLKTLKDIQEKDEVELA